ncbi:hypothetical protein [Methylobrevis pamukkalensis]|uniref:Acetophenone carboxylase gamma subunit n=1 Tax=Methylobrevis pamukkalensis TaxID=1439726 RepID=A0A1E3H473_9HYPH|nr:hypothetical protein [Methylobrevis pamukkalensis]ODN71110.1 Acetophenone carboxylase gamma subunit [Methylobrevis pamukkalensis]
MRRQSQDPADEIVAAWGQLVAQGVADITGEGVPQERIRTHRIADVRYFGEGHEVQVDVPDDLDGPAAVAHVFKQFHRVHEDTFGFHYEGEQDVEIVNLRLQAVGLQSRPEIRAVAEGGAAAAPFGTRRVYWRQTGWVDCPLYTRIALVAGQSIAGPAIVEEYGSTVVVPTSWTLTPDRYGNLVLVKQTS